MKIALIGYGKMGREIEQIALERGHEIVSIVDVNNPQEFDSEQFSSAEVAIEFTNPASAFDNIKKAFSKGVKVVSGSTGWFEQNVEEVKQLCQSGNTLFWSSNFSLGVAIFRAVNKYMAKIMNNYPGYDVKMCETHHIHKLDAPSGTAITVAETIVNELDRKTEWLKGSLARPDRCCPAICPPMKDALVIDSVREGEVFGIHTVAYESEADVITFTHDAKNRKGFALGAVLAAEYAADHSGLLSMGDLFPFLND